MNRFPQVFVSLLTLIVGFSTSHDAFARRDRLRPWQRRYSQDCCVPTAPCVLSTHTAIVTETTTKRSEVIHSSDEKPFRYQNLLHVTGQGNITFGLKFDTKPIEKDLTGKAVSGEGELIVDVGQIFPGVIGGRRVKLQSIGPGTKEGNRLSLVLYGTLEVSENHKVPVQVSIGHDGSYANLGEKNISTGPVLIRIDSSVAQVFTESDLQLGWAK